MIGIFYDNKAELLLDLNKTKQLNNYICKKRGKAKHLDRDVNDIPYTYYLTHPNGNSWFMVCDNNNTVENLLKKVSENIPLDWFEE